MEIPPPSWLTEGRLVSALSGPASSSSQSSPATGGGGCGGSVKIAASAAGGAGGPAAGEATNSAPQSSQKGVPSGFSALQVLHTTAIFILLTNTNSACLRHYWFSIGQPLRSRLDPVPVAKTAAVLRATGTPPPGRCQCWCVGTALDWYHKLMDPNGHREPKP